jgi:hypothetical protein
MTDPLDELPTTNHHGGEKFLRRAATALRHEPPFELLQIQDIKPDGPTGTSDLRQAMTTPVMLKVKPSSNSTQMVVVQTAGVLVSTGSLKVCRAQYHQP